MTPDHTLLTAAATWLDQGWRVAVATVIATWGSSPRPVGSLLVVRGDGAFEGSVSGGCIETAVVSEALDLLQDGEPPRVLDVGVTNREAWEAGLACGGRLRVQVRAVTDPAPLRALVEQAPAALVHGLAFPAGAVVSDAGVTGDLELDDLQLAAVRAAIAADRSTVLDTRRGEVFALVQNPPLRLIVVGAVHIAQALVPLARTVGFQVTVVDPRGAFATAARMPGVALVEAWPGEALADLHLDARTAVITLTHEPRLDDAALEHALHSPAYHIGSLGSRRTHAARLERLRRRGISEADLGRIKGPVGLPLGGRRPEEIALSIVAELVAARHGRLAALGRGD